jgi:phosphotransferase system HPr (HPr) family protein
MDACMNGEPLRCQVRITNAEGLHMRPMQAFVELAARFASAVKMAKADDKWIDGKNPWELLGLGAVEGTDLTLEVAGPDAPQAMSALVDFLQHLTEFEEALQAPGEPNV